MPSQHISLLKCAKAMFFFVTKPSLRKEYEIPTVMMAALKGNQVKLKKIQKEVHLSSISQQNYIPSANLT